MTAAKNPSTTTKAGLNIGVADDARAWMGPRWTWNGILVSELAV